MLHYNLYSTQCQKHTLKLDNNTITNNDKNNDDDDGNRRIHLIIL